MSRPWFPFYVGDYVRDTARLSTEGHGAYLLLMLDYWANGAPPDDDETLASIARLPLEQWVKLRSKIAPFFDVADGRWSHGRIEKELALAEEKHQKRVNAGKAGGEAKAKNKHSPSIASSNAEALPYQSQSQPQSQKEESSSSVAAATRPKEPSRFEEFWRECPRRDGANPRKPAETRFNSLVKTGLDPQMLIDEAVKWRRAEEGRGKVGSPYVARVTTWLGEQRWTDHAALAALSEIADPQWQEKHLADAVKMFAKGGFWSRHAGPAPGLTGCKASPELLAQYGLLPDGRKMPPREAA